MCLRFSHLIFKASVFVERWLIPASHCTDTEKHMKNDHKFQEDR